MRSTFLAWLGNAVDSLRNLGDRPWTLFIFLLALNALASPYAGITHDARLYAFQVQNHLDNGAYNDDLFFRYGSQDSYSIFSTVVAPLAARLGLVRSFFLLYVLGNSLFLFAMQRFVRALLPDPLLSSLTLIFLVVTPIPYGGMGSFHVMECFLTPRVLATALVLLALELLLRGRYLLALLLLAAGCLIHPLMACGGLLVLALFVAGRCLSQRLFLALAILGVTTTGFVLGYAPVGYRLFGRMDSEWLDVLSLVTPYLFPDQWGRREWIVIVIAQAVVTVAASAVRRHDPRRGNFLAAVAVVGAAAVAATLLAEVMGYRILLQGQPYRFLWLVRLMQAPLTVYLSAQLYMRGDEPHRLLAVGLLSTLTLSVYSAPERLFFVLCLFVLAVLFRGLGIQRFPADPDEAGAPTAGPGWANDMPGVATGSDGKAATSTLAAAAALPRQQFVLAQPQRKPTWSLLLAISLAAALVGGAVHREIVIARVLPTLAGKDIPVDACRIVLVNLGPAVWLLLSLLMVNAIERVLGLEIRAGLILGACFVLVQQLPFALAQAENCRLDRRQCSADPQFVADFLKQTGSAEKRTLRLYWTNEFETTWLDLHAASYFDQHQQVGSAVFYRQTALECKRRAEVVGRFELSFMVAHLEFIDPLWMQNMVKLFRSDPRDATPTRADLARLCHEDMVDYAILRHDFGALASASNGHVYIYDCKRLRTLLPRP